MMDELEPKTEAGVIAALAAAAVDNPTVEIADGVFALREPAGWGHAVIDSERYRSHPRRRRGHARFEDVDSLARYVDLQGDVVTVYADRGTRQIVAVFDDHRHGLAGWLDFSARAKLATTDEWDSWMGLHRGQVSQGEFIEHLEDWRHTVAEPATADILDLIRTFRATKRVTFQDERVDANGDRHLVYQSETSAGGTGELEVPDTFTLALSPLVGSDVVPVEARFRYRVHDGGTATFGVVLDQPNELLNEAFDWAVGQLEDALSVSVLYGRPANEEARGRF